ncbi:MAG: hypothetical protein GTN38_01045, partial [Candidatus Aenigmarchaeota archaeon]|nr:hypothetical protein [Candidatus Aenigmarchaeota archaeon]NIP40181.1 hypothetical protein [Candidatus Aenigmarchaeota archaeon]NIQ17218.1 hypothetical protein [Candidatus Aenigmarchaeota archaeon]NIS73008.1 hypothetical protein [Candidatus Aenigmarchaeota archaeon]
DFSCDVKITPPGEALTGENQIDVTIRVSDGKTYTLTNQTRVYLLPGEFQMDIQSITPDKLYCQGHKQTNPEQVKVNAKLMNLQADSLLQEKIIFDGQEIQHADRYCTFQAGSITCNIPTAKLLEKVTCGQGELAPGEGLHYYSFSLSVLLKKGEEFIQVSGSTDLGVEAIPLQAYLEITDSDIENGFLKESINCLGSRTIRLGDGGNYIRIRYADLLHQTPEESDLTWSFRLDAYDDSGKLTKGMGSSPTANATICKMKSYQQVGVHRYEDYECTLFVDRQMFQRCATGEGTITLTVLSKTMGRSAEGEFQVAISRGEEDFNLYIQVEKDASDEITCWVVSEDGRCNLERSQLNATLSVKNRAKGDIGDLRLLDSDIQLKGGDIDMDVYSPYCRETAKGTRKFQCGFGIKPSMKIEEKVSNETEHEQIFKDIDLGELEFTALVKYADGLAEDSLKANIGSVTIKPQKDPNFLDYQKQKEKMKSVVKTVQDIVKGVLFVAGFCVTCAAGTWIYQGATENKTKTSPYEPENYIPETGGKIGFADSTDYNKCWEGCKGSCISNPAECSIFHEVDDDLSYPNGCASDQQYCCCPKEQSEWEPQLTFPEIPSGITDTTSTFNTVINENTEKLTKCRDWTCAIIVLVAVAGLFAFFEFYLGKKIFKGDYTKWLMRGFKAGLICVVLQILGGVLGEGEGDHVLTVIGEGLNKACIFLARAFPALIALLSIVMRWITFEMCVEDIERSLDQGYYGSGEGASAYRSGLVGTQSALSRLQGCMNQFNRISQEAWMIGQSMAYSGVGLWGTASLRLTREKTGEDLEKSKKICKNEQIKFEVNNWCKVIMESGNDAQWLRITSDSGNSCRNVPLFSAETCRAFYGYGYGTGWGSGWGGGGYRTLTQAPGKNKGIFSPVTYCGDDDKVEHIYTLLNPEYTLQIKYYPNSDC